MNKMGDAAGKTLAVWATYGMLWGTVIPTP